MARRMKKKKASHAKKNYKLMFLTGTIVFLFFVFISVIFSLINMGSKKIVSGVKIGNVDMSSLTKEEATEKLQNWYKGIVLSDILVSYEQVEENIKIEQFGATIDIDRLVKEACLVGKSGNIVKDNYEILFSMIFKKNIELNIQMNEEEIDKKIDEINKKLPNAMEQSNYYIEENNLIIKKGKNGIQIKKGIIIPPKNKKSLVK